MTLSDMENKDDVFEALKALSTDNSIYIPAILENYLKKVANSGKTNQSWEQVKPLILKKFQINCEEFLSNGYPEPNSTNVRYSNEEIDRLKNMIQNKLNEFENIPFTIQRLSELLSEPRKNYSRIDKYLRGLEKVVLVVSVVDQYGNKICDNNHYEYSDNGSFNESSELVISEKADSNEDQTENMNDFYPLRDNFDDIETRKMDIPTLVDSPVTWKSKSFNYASIHRTELNTSPTKNFPEEASTTESSEDQTETDLRPIGQLEAFVQNVGLAASQSPGTSSSLAKVSPSEEASSLPPVELAEDALELNKSHGGDDLDKTEPMEDSDCNISAQSIGQPAASDKEPVAEEITQEEATSPTAEQIEESRKRALVEDEIDCEVPQSPCKQSKTEDDEVNSSLEEDEPKETPETVKTPEEKSKDPIEEKTTGDEEEPVKDPQSDTKEEEKVVPPEEAESSATTEEPSQECEKEEENKEASKE